MGAQCLVEIAERYRCLMGEHIESRIWRLDEDGGPRELSATPPASEERIERAVGERPEVLGLELLPVARQAQTPGGPLDLVGVDPEGRVVVVEFKRDRAARRAVAQLLDYSSWLAALGRERRIEYLTGWYRGEGAVGYGGAADDVSVVWADRYESDPEYFGSDEVRMLLAAGRLDRSTSRMILYLAERGIPISDVLFTHFKDGEAEWLIQSSTVDLDLAEDVARRGRREHSDRDWDGSSWYFRIGADHRIPEWPKFRELGFVSSGGNPRYRSQMEKNFRGQEGVVYVHLTGHGFVGVGNIDGAAVPWQDAVLPGPDGAGVKLADVYDPDWIREHLSSDDPDYDHDDPDYSEYVLPVRWVATCAADEGLWEKGAGLFYGMQSNVVRKMVGPKAEMTIERVLNHLGIDPDHLD
jgi:hypothetical protein